MIRRAWISVGLVALVFAVGCGQGDTPAVECDEDTEPLPASVPTYSELAWSPDGRRIAFTVKSRVTPNGVYRQYVHVATAGEPEFARLTDREASESMPSWSPDGKQIRFLSSDDLVPGVFVVGADGTGLRRLTTGEVWSPDGERTAFVKQSDEQARIHITGADGAELNVIDTGASAVNSLAWSPDGRRLAFIAQESGSSRSLLVASIDGSAVIQLPSHDGDALGSPTWSPDGERIAFNSSSDTNNDISVVNADGSGLTSLTSHPAIDTGPVWSPNGERIAFSSNREHGGGMRIWVVNADGSEATQISDALGGNHGLPAWSPDGRWIMFNHVFTTIVERKKYYPIDQCMSMGHAVVIDSGIQLVRPDGNEQIALVTASEQDIAVDWTAP